MNIYTYISTYKFHEIYYYFTEFLMFAILKLLIYTKYMIY